MERQKIMLFLPCKYWFNINSDSSFIYDVFPQIYHFVRTKQLPIFVASITRK